MKDKMRLKWIEINSLAVTIHHVFDRLNHVFSFGGLSEIEEVVKVEYPSWITRSILNETGSKHHAPPPPKLSTEFLKHLKFHNMLKRIGVVYFVTQTFFL